MARTEQAIEQEQHFCAKHYHPLPVMLARGKGAWLWDIEDRKYLDMMSAYSAVSHGHCHPKLVSALCEQASKLCVTSRAFYHDQMTPFLEKLCALSGMDKGLPMNTGAEAVETALKAARRWGYQVKNIPKDKAEIIVADNNFHGRTLSIISFSTDSAYKKDFGPLTPGFVSVPFGDVDALKAAITPNTCAILLEPIQGESGIIIPPDGYLKAVREICDDNQVLMILDEIQSGLGRTGKMFAFEHEAIEPDGLILGKALGGGVIPVSCFLAKARVMSVFDPGSHGSTFGGNALAAHVARVALEVLEEENLVTQSHELGIYVQKWLKAIDSPYIKAIRGRGLWIGLEVDPQKIRARALCEALMKEGILTKEAHETVIRLAPPLVINQAECDWALSIIGDVLSRPEKN